LKLAFSLGTNNSEYRGFFCPRLAAVNSSQSEISQFSTGFVCSDVIAVRAFMSICNMFFCSKAFKVVRAVVCFNTVNVMDLFFGRKARYPTSSYYAVHQPAAAQHKVSLGMLLRGVRLQLSKNFSATRNSIKMVKDTVLSVVHCKANHVAPILVVARFSSYH
jgi:hypothetical protein